MFEYPIYFDIENKTQLSLSEELLQKITIAFCNELEAAGYWVGIYSYKSFLESNFTPEILKRYVVWVAHTGVTKTNFKYPHGIWQYSHTGRINGINTNVELNYGYIDYPKSMKTAGLNGFSKNDKVQIITHTVVKNDSLWAIDGAAKAELTVTYPDGRVESKVIHEFKGGGIIQGMHNTDASIARFARACFNYALSLKQDLWFSTKDTISKIYDHRFKDIFAEIYEAEYKAAFLISGLAAVDWLTVGIVTAVAAAVFAVCTILATRLQKKA